MSLPKIERGFTLIELMVATTIFLIVSVVVFTVLGNSEDSKRATTSVNDIDQSGAYGLYTMGNWLRSAGSDFAQNYAQAYGCELNAYQSTSAVLPAAAFPAPFASVGGTLRLAPVLIYKNASQSGSDVIAIMAGSGATDQASQSLVSVPTSSSINPYESYTVNPGDLLLITDQAGSTSMTNCLLEQVSSSYTAGSLPITLAGTYASAGPTATPLTGFSVNGTYTDIGSASNPPNFLLIGVGPSASGASNSSLFAYDVLKLSMTAPTPIVDNVVEMHALYGLDTNGDGVVATWQDPGTSPYDSTPLLNGSTASRANLCKIKAVSVGLIMRTDIAERQGINGGNLTQNIPPLFDNLIPAATSLKYAFTVPSAGVNYRYRVLEEQIPLRNNLLNSAPYSATCS